MKKEIKIIVFQNGVFKITTAKAEKYDELTYYVSSLINNDNEYIKEYCIIDKNTGIAVCYGKNKKELIEKYEKIKEKYEKFRELNYYKKLINQYNEMLEKEKEVK